MSQNFHSAFINNADTIAYSTGEEYTYQNGSVSYLGTLLPRC